MMIEDKMIKVAGRGPNGYPHPIEVDGDGNLKVVVEGGQIDGGVTDGTMNAIDISSGQSKAISALQDPEGNYVLRTVDSAPFVMTAGAYENSQLRNVSLSSVPLLLFSDNADRKMISLTNASDVIIFVGEIGKGVPIMPNEKYEMTLLKGNLYRGDVYAWAYGLSDNLFDESRVSQGGVTSTTHSSSLTRTRLYPIEVEPNSLYTMSVDGDVKIRQVISYSESGVITNGVPLTEDIVEDSVTIFTKPNTVQIAVGFCKTNLDSNLTPSETVSANPRIAKAEKRLIGLEGY